MDKRQFSFSDLCDYFDYDGTILQHYEESYNHRQKEIDDMRMLLIEKIRAGCRRPVYTMADYLNWRANGWTDADVKEKIEWNNIRKSIVSYMTQERPTNHDNGSNDNNCECNESLLLIEKISELEKENTKLWTLIINYRTTLNIAQGILGSHPSPTPSPCSP